MNAEAELTRIVEGIKTCDTTIIVEGNDMVDWGWASVRDQNIAANQVWSALNSLECVKNEEDRGEIFGLLQTLGLVK